MLDPQLMQPTNGLNSMDSMPSQQAALLGAPPLDPSWGYDLNLLSHAASHVASTGQNPFDSMGGLPQVTHEPMQEPMQQMIHSHSETSYPTRMLTEGYGNPAPLFETPDLGDPMQDFTIFLDSVGLSSDWHSGIFNSIEQNDMISPELKNETLGGAKTNGETGDSKLGIPQEESTSFSRFGSRLPSLQPESRDPEQSRPQSRNFDESGNVKAKTAWDLSDADRQTFANKLASFESVLPKGFIAPSRHSLSRYLAGYINGFHEHLPFIHVPSLSVAAINPELTIALAAVGAQYRFENSRAIELFYAAKAVVMEQIRRRDGAGVSRLWQRPSSGSLSQHSPGGGFQVSTTVSSPFQFNVITENGVPDNREQMGSIQALLLLTAFATWERHQELLREALAFQSTLARLVREAGLHEEDHIPSFDNLTWDEWIRIEGDRRTKLIVYCFFNLHSITWNVPPLILNSEIHLNLPEPANEWKATTAAQWRKLHELNATQPVQFQPTFAKLFSKTTQSPGPSVTPLGNYVLIHALIQQIFFARQLSTSWPSCTGSSLRTEDIAILERGLSAWKTGWKRTPESSLDPQNPNGPVAFTSTAFLGLAYIRLHMDMGPLRHLESRDSRKIAESLRNTPPIQRNPRLIPALLHSAHALSIPVRLGIDFVAKTQTFFWSIQHSLCSLECAFLLSKWLAALSTIISDGGAPLSEHERKLLVWVRSMLEETEMAIPTGKDGNTENLVNASQELLEDQRKIRQLSVAVVRVWSKTFKGNTSWAIVDMIGGALEIYADTLEAEFESLERAGN